MTKNDELATLIDKLAATALDCRSVIREAHEATQDLRSAIKDYRAILDSSAVLDLVNNQVTSELEILGRKVREQQRESVRVILKNFDDYSKPLADSFVMLADRQRKLAEAIGIAERDILPWDHPHHFSDPAP